MAGDPTPHIAIVENLGLTQWNEVDARAVYTIDHTWILLFATVC
jgi:hypothetical protein